MTITIDGNGRCEIARDKPQLRFGCVFSTERVRFRTRVCRPAHYVSGTQNRRTSVVTKKIAPMRQLAQHHPLHPLMIVIGVLIVAATGKLGHGMWGIGGMFAFYPTYLAMLVAGRSASALLARLSLPPLAAQERAYARVRVSVRR
jgi:hypothetical protein